MNIGKIVRMWWKTRAPAWGRPYKDDGVSQVTSCLCRGVPLRVPWFYRLRQVRQQLGFVEPLSGADLEEVKRLLPHAAFTLFQTMSDADQQHSLRVCRGLQARGCTEQAMLMAALLHDVGKAEGRVPFWTRPAIVMGKRLAPRLLARLTISPEQIMLGNGRPQGSSPHRSSAPVPTEDRIVAGNDGRPQRSLARLTITSDHITSRDGGGARWGWGPLWASVSQENNDGRPQGSPPLPASAPVPTGWNGQHIPKWQRSLSYAWWHAEVGAALAAQAGLPERAVLYIRTHHQAHGPAAELHNVDEVS